MDKGDLPSDPRGLIFEAYRMEIGEKDARTIFLDWALGPPGGDPAAIAELLAYYGPRHPAHPMTAVLREAGTAAPPPPSRRRGGPAARRR